MYSGVYHDKTCHEPDAAAVLQRAWNAGVEKIIITAGTLQEAKDALEFSQRDHRLFCTVGVHPTRCGEFESHPEGPEAYFQELGKVRGSLQPACRPNLCALFYTTNTMRIETDLTTQAHEV